VINRTYRNTSMIRTMRERWNLGEPLTARDADAADIGPVLTLDRPRAPQDWPDVAPLPVPAFNETLIPLNQPLTPLAQALVMGCLALAQQLDQTLPPINDAAALNGAEGLAIMHETARQLWQRLQHSTSA
jgi:phospholipase C